MGNEVAYTGVLMSAIAAAGVAWNAWTQRKQKQDQLDFDSKFVQLEANYKHCEERHEDVEKRLQECHDEHKRSENDRSRLWHHVARLQEFVQAPASGSGVHPQLGEVKDDAAKAGS